MWNWLREYYELRRESRVCESCETLRRQLEISNLEKERLLNRILERPNESQVKIEVPEPKVIMPKVIPWAVQKQMLEQEDREKAKLIRQAPKPTDELEKGLLTEVENAKG